MASLFDLTRSTLSFYSVPAAFILQFLPNAWAMVAAGRNYDLCYPRRMEETCNKDQSLDKASLTRILRAKAAANNGLESIGFYAGGIAAANAAGVPAETINSLAIAYIGLRIVYNFIYIILQANRNFAPLRTLTWMTSIGVISSLYIKAGNLIAAA
ncbi:putative membrane protein [Phaeoacremonium minimum UCRPA7]|uniref:Putative membrane protein n=1 Tax=Phaeoacremonium minimum (strain UCR-PA7) TaxID=1286976 RepID=R8BYE9_PHAM7|nr:putative membrane protein [Phaeoacremonium minimum UCRPA7]EOO04416.1 putative membrane protein [Phaeoacremonium minimum UCRPA7]